MITKNGVAGAKPPTGTRGGSPSKIAPFLGKGVEDKHFFEITDFFYKLKLRSLTRAELNVIQFSLYVCYC